MKPGFAHLTADPATNDPMVAMTARATAMKLVPRSIAAWSDAG